MRVDRQPPAQALCSSAAGPLPRHPGVGDQLAVRLAEQVHAGLPRRRLRPVIKRSQSDHSARSPTARVRLAQDVVAHALPIQAIASDATPDRDGSGPGPAAA